MHNNDFFNNEKVTAKSKFRLMCEGEYQVLNK